MDKDERRKAIFAAESKGKGFTVRFIGNGEVVRYFDGQRSIDCEVTWSWKEPNAANSVPTRVPPVQVHSNSLCIVEPRLQSRPVPPSESQLIATRIRDALQDQGVAAIIK